MLPVAIANTALLNVRSGPDTGYVLVTTISEETWVEVIGVNAQSDWFKVKYDDVGGQGWIYRELTYLAGPLSSATQTASAGSPTSTQPASTQPAAPTPQPASTPQVAVGSITVDLSLPSNGTIDLEVSWTDAGACFGALQNLLQVQHRLGHLLFSGDSSPCIDRQFEKPELPNATWQQPDICLVRNARRRATGGGSSD